MKTAKSILSLFLALIMAMAVLVPAFAEDKDKYKVGDTVEFGSYPQTEIKIKENKDEDEKIAKENEKTEALLAKLDSKLGSGWKSYSYWSGDSSLTTEQDIWKHGEMKENTGLMSYQDVTLTAADGVEKSDCGKYRAVKIYNYRPQYTGKVPGDEKSYQDDNGYVLNTTYWFKYEPLKWEIVKINMTSAGATVGLAVCKSIIDAQPVQNYVKDYPEEDTKNIDGEYYSDNYYTTKIKVNGKEVDKKVWYYANNYAQSTIRTWLSGTFANTAFSGFVDYSGVKCYELNCLESLYIDNASNYSKYSSASTNDKIFLPSKEEAVLVSSSSRKGVGTDYAKIQGLWVAPGSDESTGSTYSYWRLRTAGEHSSASYFVDTKGAIANNNDVDFTCSGIRPAINLNLPIHDHNMFKSDWIYDNQNEIKYIKCKVCGKIIQKENVYTPVTHAEVNIAKNPKDKSITIRYGQRMQITADIDNVPKNVVLVCFYGDHLGAGKAISANDKNIIGTVPFSAATADGSYNFKSDKLKEDTKMTVQLFESGSGSYKVFQDPVDSKIKYDTEIVNVRDTFLLRVLAFFRNLFGIDSVVTNR